MELCTVWCSPALLGEAPGGYSIIVLYQFLTVLVSKGLGSDGRLLSYANPAMCTRRAKVYRIDLDTVEGFGVSFTTYGATLLSVRAGDRTGTIEEVRSLICSCPVLSLTWYAR